jgi:tetratricopeptide (TPR) repeat protein
MQRLFERIWQWLKSILGLEKTQGNRRGKKIDRDTPQNLSDTDYEFLFSQLLEGVARGWHEGRILKFFQKLGEQGKQKYWVAWLERFGAKALASAAPNQQLAARMMRLGELAQSFPDIEQIGQTSYTIGRKIYTRNVGDVIWEYEGADAEVPASPLDLLPDADAVIELENAPATGENLETMTIDELLVRLQSDRALATQMAGQLGIETTDPQIIVEKLIESFGTAQQEIDTQKVPDTVEEWFDRGLQQANLGDLEGAIASWENALGLNPNLAQAWHNRGSALAHLGRLEDAIASYNKAVELNPNDAQAWNARAYALYNLRRWEEAIICWDKVIELQPNFHEGWYNRGCALENWGRVEAAIASFRKALEIQPDFELAKSKLDQLQDENK